MYYVWLNKDESIKGIYPQEIYMNLGMTEDELLKNGLYVNSIPTMEYREGFNSEIKYSKDRGLYCEYIARELTQEEQLNSLGEQLAQEKLKNIQKDATISQLGQELAKLKLEVINMKGGN